MLAGKEFVKLSEKIIKENPEAFEALLEFERSKKLPRLKYKKRVNFTIDSDILKKFRLYCKEHNIKMSTKTESLIEEFIKRK